MDYTQRIEEFIRGKYYTELLTAVKEDEPLIIDFAELDRYEPVLADQLLEEPEQLLKQFHEAVKNIEGSLLNVRIKNLPERRQIRIRSLRAKHLGKLLMIDTIIKSASEVKPQVQEAIFQCPECGTKIPVLQDSNILEKPYQCDCGRRGDFELVAKKMIDIRWLGGVEPFELTTGERPGEISVFLKEDLTTPRMQRKTDPGNRIKVVGVLKELPKRIKGKLSTRMDMYLEANYIEPSEIEFEELEISEQDERLIKDLASDPNIYEKLKASIAPGIYGFDEIKEALVLQMFGGNRKVLPDGMIIRGNIHVLLTGDPGVGKTVLLKLVSSIMPRGRYVSGSGVSGAGLTATVVKNEAIGGWVLEAGALILCNKGLIAIDEFDKMNRDDQIAMHEATSAETVSIAKASIVATLPAQTAVLAGANPKLGRFVIDMPIAQQLDIPETLLSRFDLKFALKDKPDRAQDERLADHIIMSRTRPEIIEPVVDRNLLRKYIAYAKQISDIELTPESAEVLKNFYVDMRNQYATGETFVVSITLRQYEALIRLSEASAKIRLSNKIEIQDADRAINLMKYSLQQLGYDVETGRFDIDKLESGMTTSRRNKIVTVLKIIEKMQREEGKEVALEDIKAAAEELGLGNIDEIIEHLKREGSVFEPRPGFIRKI